LGWKELVSIPGAVLRQKLVAAELARSAFDSFDRYKRGSIEYKEVRNAVQAYGLNPSAEGAVELLARYDATPESQLSRGEWAALVKSLEEKLGPVGGPVGGAGGAGRSASGLESTLAIREAADMIYDRVFQEARRLRKENRALRRQLGDEEGVIILEPASDYDDQPLRYGAAAAPSAAAAANLYARTRTIGGVAKGGVAPKGGVAKDGPAAAAAAAAMAMEKKIRDAFAAFDENQSGFLDSKKLRNALRLYGIRLDRPEVEQVIARLSAW
jgi:Ca2+-binding EF-hand superfamily protein